jgi:amidase
LAVSAPGWSAFAVTASPVEHVVRALPSDELLRAPALEQAALIRSGALSSEELTRAYLSRIERYDPELSAFVQVLKRRALLSARLKDRRGRGSRVIAKSPFYGVPTGIKDLNLVRGAFTRLGSRAYRYAISPIDDRSAAHLREAGFVFLGKLATSEFGALPVTEPDIHPPTRNPWDLERTAGGSSGGSGAAVAAGLLPIAHASDGAGSIRIPASLCHLYGFKPSRGRVPDAHFRPDRDSFVTCGPISRSVEDAAAMLDVLAGITTNKPHWAPPPERPFLELARRPPRRLRIRFTSDSAICTTAPEIAAAVRRVATLLADLGHDVEEGTTPQGSLEEFLPLWRHLIAQIPVIRRSVLQPVTRWLSDSGRSIEARTVRDLQNVLASRILGWFGDVDLYLTPTVPISPPRIGAFKAMAPQEAFESAAPLGAFTAIYNVSGQPAASIPAGFDSEGLPIGIQIAGRVNDDATVLSVSRQLEVAMPWAHLTPDLFR